MNLNLDDLREDQEYALLLSCCRARVRETDTAAQRQLADGLDSERFLDLVDRHLVAPLASGTIFASTRKARSIRS